MKIPDKWRSLFWIAVVIAALLLTWIGLSQHYPQTNTLRYLPDRIFRLLKTITGADPLGSGVEPQQIPMALILAKIMVILIMLRALLKIIEKVFQEQYAQLRALFKRRHLIVVAAGGSRSRHLLKDYLNNSGNRAVIIAEQADDPQLPALRRDGHIVLKGSAASRDTLLNAGVLRAQALICPDSDEDGGLRIAAALAPLLTRRSGQALRCYLPLNNPRLMQLFAGQNALAEGMDIRFFNLEKMLARHFFHRLPQQLGAQLGRAQLHILILGFGKTAQALLLQGLRVFHRLPGQDNRWTVITADAAARAGRFFDRYPQIPHIGAVDFHEDDGRLRQFIRSRLADLPADGQIIVLCAAEDAGENLDSAIELISAHSAADFPVFVYGSSPQSAALLEDDVRRRLHFFGGEAEICSYELITGQQQDRLAQAIHADYLRQIGALGQGGASESAAYQTQWQQLSEDAKDANRAQADHILYKLLLSGQDPAVPVQFSAADIEQLAAAEHRRWAAHRYLNSWHYAPVRDDAAKPHPSLIDWEQLSESEKQKDRDTVIRIAALLAEHRLF